MNLAKKNLVGLKADGFRHPLDLQATNALKQLPGLDIAIRSVLGSVAEQFFYLNNIASSILVNEKQLPHFHQLLLEACQILDLLNLPNYTFSKIRLLMLILLPCEVNSLLLCCILP